MTDISDHLPIFITTNLRMYRKNDNTEIEFRELSDKNIACFKKELANVDWATICNSDDVNVSYSKFVDTFNKIYDNCVPKKKKRIYSKKDKPKSPWLSYALLKCIRRKNRLYKKYINKPNDSNLEKFKKYRNKLNCTLRLAKQNYYCDLLKSEKNYMRNTWKIINSIIRSKSNTYSEKFVSNNSTITCPKEIATEFNRYFANIGPSLASTIQHSGKNYSSYLQNSNSKTCFFKPTDEAEITKLIKKLGSRKSAGHDGIKSDVIKMVANEISYPLKLLFNKSLANGSVPDELKIAKVVPIYKKDSPECFGNYRPVSVLPCLSKILERIVYNRTYDFLTKNEILYKQQYGFRSNHSTYMAVHDFVNNISDAIDKDKHTIGIFMDLSKAFDTIDHNILLNKLYHYGLRGISYDWFKNYLSNRKQFVTYNSCKSPKESVSCGVPQGSILGPLLFILYMNDICYTSKLLNTILFADDTTVFCSHPNLSTLCKNVNKELKEVSNWFKANKLSLNAKKTNLMYLGTRKQTSDVTDDVEHAIYLDGCKLSRVTEAKFLGITIDENLTWKKHVDNFSKVCSRNIGVLSKVKSFLPANTMYTLYCSLVLPYLNYGLLLWGNSSKQNVNKVFKIQKRAIRVITNSDYLSSTKPLFNRLKTLNVFDMYTREVATFMFKYKNDMLPLSFNHFFTIHRDNHDYNTRNRDDFKFPAQKIETISSFGPKVWNKLPKNVKQANTLNQFRSLLKSELLSVKHH